MIKLKIKVNELSEVNRKYLKIIIYLTFSNALGYAFATYILNDPMLTVIFGPTINFIAWIVEKELKKEGYNEALRK